MWQFDSFFFGTSFILLLSCLSNALSSHVLLKCNKTWVVWIKLSNMMRFTNGPNKICPEMQHGAHCVPEGMNDIIQKVVVHNPLYVLSFLLLFYLTFQFTFTFNNVQTIFCPLFSASLATASKVSRFLFSNDMIVTWRHWSWWMRLCPSSSIWCFLRKKKESKWHPADTQGLSYQDKAGNVGIYMKTISLGR